MNESEPKIQPTPIGTPPTIAPMDIVDPVLRAEEAFKIIRKPMKGHRSVISKSRWEEIQHAYVTEDWGLHKLALLYGVSYNTLHTRINRDKWVLKRETARLQRSAKHARAIEEKEKTLGPQPEKTDKSEQIRSLTSTAQKLLARLEARADVLTLVDDKELKQSSDTLINLHGMLKELMGIGKGDGDQKVGPGRVQLNILQETVDAADAFAVEERKKRLSVTV